MIKKLAKSIREYKKASILTSLFVTLEVILEIIIPFVMAEMIDNGISRGNQSYLTKVGFVMILCALLSLTFGILSGSYCATAAAGFAKNLRKDLYYKIQDFSFANIDKFSTSSLITRLTTDITNVQNAYMMIIRVAVRAPLMLIFSLIAAFVVNVKISLMFLIVVPILAIGLFVIVKKSFHYFEKVFYIYDHLNVIVQENLMGIRVVKSFVREGFEITKFSKISKNIYDTFLKAEGIIAYNMPLMQFSVYSTLILISWFGAKMIITSNSTALTTGELTSLIAYALNVLNCLMMLSNIMVIINIASASAERIEEVLDEESSLKNNEIALKSVSDGSIDFEDVGFSYIDNKDKECLKNINLHIESGSTIGIVGGTGSGKSSFDQLIPRLYDVTEGTVKVGGVNVKDYDIATLRNEVSMILQKNVLFSGTIKENLRWGNENASDEELISACKLAQADPFIQTFPDKYDTYIEQGGTNVSGGQKQRICIARALLKKPKILILDDSTSAVDTKTDALIRKAFKEQTPDTTKIIIAQRISSVEDADKIIVMDNGVVNGIGTHNELLNSNSIYKEIYESQMKGDED